MASRGEQPSFSVVYETHVDFVWSMARRLGVPASLLEDAVQDVFMVVHRRLGEFRGESQLKTWVGGIAVRVAHEYRRRALRGEDVEQLDDARQDFAGPSDPHRDIETAQAWSTLERMLGELDDEQRTVFVLAELEELSAPQIAEIVQVSVNTVYSRLRLARAKLQRALESMRRGSA